MENMIINPAQQVHGREEIDAATQVIESGFWAEGPKAKEFKHALANFLGVRYVELTNSGSSANLAAVMALTTHWIEEDRRIKQGDEVITTALCFPTTVAPIKYAGAVPVFVDVDQSSWNIDPDQVEGAITEKTKAIIVAHNLGSPFDIDRIVDICKRHNLWLIEDNCDALGSKWKGQHTGTFGDIATSSFYPAHHISTGEGGAVYTNNPMIKRALESMINWGRDCWCEPGCDNTCGKRYGHQLGNLPFGYDHKNTYAELGFNLKMTDIQAAIGVEQLKRLPEFTVARRFNHDYLTKIFAQFPDWFQLHRDYESAESSWFGYVVKLNRGTPFTRDEMVKFLEERGIRSRAFFCGNITRQPALYERDTEFKTSGDLRVSDDIMESAFWIGVHPAIKKEERKYMSDIICQFLDQWK